jgi:hypothetical protein
VEQTKREEQSEREKSDEGTQRPGDREPGPADSAQQAGPVADRAEVKPKPVWVEPKAASSGGWGSGKGCRCFFMTLLVLGGIVAAACGGCFYLGESDSGDDTMDVDPADLEELDIDLGPDN